MAIRDVKLSKDGRVVSFYSSYSGKNGIDVAWIYRESDVDPEVARMYRQALERYTEAEREVVADSSLTISQWFSRRAYNLKAAREACYKSAGVTP